jgi:NAD+ kinase
LPKTSTAGLPQPSAEPVRRAAIVLHGRPDRVAEAVTRVERLAHAAGVELTEESPELAIVLGGDGTMLRALQRYLAERIPVIGVNFGRVGFLASMQPEDLEQGLARAFAGDYVVYELPTVDAVVGTHTVTAINDVVATSAALGRMGEVDWFVANEEMGRVPCDGVITSTPTGSTAYNLSNGGPVLMWGLDALAITFVAPHSLHARPVVVPRGRPVEIRNVSVDVPLAVIADGHRFADLPPGGTLNVELGKERSLLATLPDSTFVTRYKGAFA